jgi:hypothetical protein
MAGPETPRPRRRCRGAADGSRDRSTCPAACWSGSRPRRRHAATAPATSAVRSVLGLSFAQRGRSATPHSVASSTSAVAVGIVGEQVPAAVEVRTAEVHLHPDHRGRRLGEHSGGAGGSRRRSGPRWRPRCARRRCGAAWRDSCAEPGGDTGPLQADAVDHPRRRLMDPGTRGCPSHGSAERDFTTKAPSPARSRYADELRRPWPAVPDATITGLGRVIDPTETDRSTLMTRGECRRRLGP